MKNLIWIVACIITMSACEKEDNVCPTLSIRDGIYYEYGYKVDNTDTVYDINMSNDYYNVYKIENQKIVARFYFKSSDSTFICWNPFITPIDTIKIVGKDSVYFSVYSNGNDNKHYLTVKKANYPSFNNYSCF